MAFKTAFLVLLLTFTISNVISEKMRFPTAQDLKERSYVACAWKAVMDVNKVRNSLYKMIPIKVVQAQSQVVAGSIHSWDILYGDSTCRNGGTGLSAVHLANCQLKPNGHRALYKVQLYSRPWENKHKLTVKKIRDVAPGEEI
ncbi:unnamed protein product [Cylicocyclus nassatus]|uniref:Cystatin domain-containing protein n=1 Tax=Cylicocyclus nassatus TaxID=53992 RepID=A0AA36H3K2_CYLNA|nr:unnamed protein product [Cylicocyclus nassatus]